MSEFKGNNQYSGLTTLQRFYEKVNKKSWDECWEWKARRNSNGYGQFYFRGKLYQAHRASWELHFNNIPRGLLVLHHCDNPSCVNPHHLWLGTDADNMQDMARKGRGTIGEKSFTRKLSRDDVKNIRKLLTDDNISGRSIAKKFGVVPQTIYDIRDGITWSWLK